MSLIYLLTHTCGCKDITANIQTSLVKHVLTTADRHSESSGYYIYYMPYFNITLVPMNYLLSVISHSPFPLSYQH